MSQKHATIRITHTVENVNVFAGETLIVWLRPGLHGDFTPEMGRARQVELRVTPYGIAEIFSTDPIVVKDFDSWYEPQKETK